MDAANDRDELRSDRIREEVRAIWDRNADYWDARMGEGNDFHKLLIEPSQLRLLDSAHGTRVLDAACGNGQFARKMADLGAKVLAVDVSERMIEKAKNRSSDYDGRIEYRVVDCANREQLLTLDERQFDHVVCTMALMDMSEIQPLVSVSAKMLKPGGTFVFSQIHPCFNSGLSKHGMERHDIGGELVEEYFVRVIRYIEPISTKGAAMQGQPSPHYYFHRPISTLFDVFFREGFVLDAMEEPVFGNNADRELF